MLLGFALDQIPDENFAGTIGDELEKTEQGEGSMADSRAGTSASGLHVSRLCRDRQSFSQIYARLVPDVRVVCRVPRLSSQIYSYLSRLDDESTLLLS